MTWAKALSAVMGLGMLLASLGTVGASPLSSPLLPPPVPETGSHPPRTAPPSEPDSGPRSVSKTPRLFAPPLLPPTAGVLPANASPPSSTTIDGDVGIQGTLYSNDTSLNGTFADTGSAVTAGTTSTTGTAGYGVTRIYGTLTAFPTPGQTAPILRTNPGSGFYMTPASSTSTATISMQGDIKIGNSSAGTAFGITQSGGAIMTVWSNPSSGGGFYGLGGNADLDSGSDIVVTNNGPGTLTIDCTIPLVCPITVSAGSVYTPCYPLLGCVSASSDYISWNGPISFTITGTVTTTAPGVYCELPESHILISIPSSSANFSMVPSQGLPVISVTSGALTPAAVTTNGDLIMTGGEKLNADVGVQGIFQASNHVYVNGTFHNVGGLTLHGQISSTGVESFPEDLFVGPIFDVSTAPGGNVTASGHLLGDWTNGSTTTLDLEGSMVVTGTLGLEGYFNQTPDGSTLDGNLSTTGSLQTSGSIVATGATEFLGTFLAGTLSATHESIVANGTTTLTGSLGVDGTTTLANGTFSANGTSTVTGTLDTSGGLTASGDILTSGTTAFRGTFLAEGNLTLPNTFLGGKLYATDCSLVGHGTTNLSGQMVVSGTTAIVSGSFEANGTSTITGTINGNKTFTLEGDATMQTLWGEDLAMTSSVEMAGVATITGSIQVRGTIASNGTDTFNSTAVDIEDAVTVEGSSYSQGSVLVDGTTYFTGEVRTTGSSVFPGMSLDGTFSLAALGGSVLAQGTTQVKGTVTLTGDLALTPPADGTPGVFHEDGTSSITGDLNMTGSVVVTGDTSLTTTSGALLYMWGNIELGQSAVITGNVNISGQVSIDGTATLGGGTVDIAGTINQIGQVYSSGSIELTGEASFDGNVSAYGTTALPGITTAGYLDMPSTHFVVIGTIQLVGSSDASGNVTVNASGYFVQGSDVIRGHSISSGSCSDVGASQFSGFVNIGDGSQFGTYLKVVGTMDTGSLTLSGTTILPDDEVTFSQGANITGSGTLSGTLTGKGSAVTFDGSSVVYGTVTTPGLPDISGPVVVTFLGTYYVITLGFEFFWFLAMVIVAAGISLVTLILAVRRRVKRIVRPLVARRVRAISWVGGLVMGAGVLAGLFGGLVLGGALATTPSSGNPADVVPLYQAAAAVVTVGFFLWVVGGIAAWRARRRAVAPRYPPVPYAPPGAYPAWPIPSYPPTAPPAPPMGRVP